ncbi:carboxypeptidase regulatory-like domain-containing protein [Adhaeretor mobilis]|uniref:Rhamnogalacturonan lyase domain-containing protein n=1 Tax=Adhaeretor mobilis TaxID=1930276 RepID=A0A517MZ71_9BACT|nr:carboxypeptidase regulatory-like domain-containing protein [Adhaeretor mobilis]QDT00165.1 hypothetical protein HG15A2_35000 [Adhaeretor mobilis]
MTSIHLALRYFLTLTVTLSALTVISNDASAAGWGSLKGKFLYKGSVNPKEITPTRDPEFCGKHKLVEEDIAVGEKNELANVYVYLYTKRNAKVEIHPDYEKAELKPAVLDNKGCRFEPHAMTVWTKQPFQVHNSDQGIGHNTNATLRANGSFNETVTNDKPLKKSFQKTETYPAPVACNVHPWMNATLLIRDNPYMAVSNEKGEFEIKNLPAGEHEIVFWHEASGTMKNLQVGKEKAGRTGRIDVEIADGETLDFGEITVTPKLLGK